VGVSIATFLMGKYQVKLKIPGGQGGGTILGRGMGIF